MIQNFEALAQRVKKSTKRTIVVAMAEDCGVLTAIQKILELKITRVILTGNRKKLEQLIKEGDIKQENLQIVDAPDEMQAIQTAVDLIKEGAGQVLMKGLCSTSNFLKAVLSKNSDLRDTKVLSHVAVFECANYPRLFLLSDAAVNIAPDLSIKIAITKNAVETAHRMGFEQPKVALLSAIEKVNYEAMPSSVDAAIIAKMADRGQLGNIIADGPLAIDNALSSDSCAIKGIRSPIDGKADILIVPNIETGNVLYKSLTLFGQARVAGILAGTKVPVVLTSRADSEDSKFLSIMLALNVSREE